MQIEIGDLVRWHSTPEFIGIVVDIKPPKGEAICDRAFVYWFTSPREIKELIGGVAGAGWEPIVYLRLFKKKLNKPKIESS